MAYVYRFKDINDNIIYVGKTAQTLDKRIMQHFTKGHLPKDLNIHHKMPLSGMDEGVNEFNNLTIIHKETHEYINRYVFSPQLKPYINEPYGTEFEIDIPEYDFVDVNGIKHERQKEAMRKQIIGKHKGR